MRRDDESGRVRFEVRDIVLVALLAAMGGVLSTYVGYIGNLVNRLFGVPFGAGQLIAGLHVIWPLLSRLLIRRFGSGILVGTTKGLVEFLAGGTHGVVIVLVSFVEGLLVDVGLGVLKRETLTMTMISGAVASASNVFVFQAIYFSGVPLTFILVMAGLSLVSGAFLGGYLAWDLRGLLTAAGIVRSERSVDRSAWWRRLITLVAVVGLLAGGVFYYVAIYNPFAQPSTVRISGAVAEPFTFAYRDWESETVTIEAELRGSVTAGPRQPYEGVPLSAILRHAAPDATATMVDVIADDGYAIPFELAEALSDDRLVLTLEEEHLRLIAGSYDGSHWVRRVTRIVVH